MQRSAIFIDAGYFYAQSALSTFNRIVPRLNLECDEEAFIAAICSAITAQNHFRIDSILRTYWYDGAPFGGPSADQLAIASLPGVKLRLGRVNRAGQQKGVDSLIVRDLMVLSQEQSISSAFLLSGDEDLREGVAYAQDRGVFVGLLKIESPRGANQSKELQREADLAGIDVTLQARKSVRLRQLTDEAPSPVPIGAESVESCIRFILEAELEARGPDYLDALADRRPVIPAEIDRRILVSISRRVLDGRTLEPDERVVARRAFWDEVGRLRN